ncbi:MAG: hypothetical protein NW226_00780 [Microscillaceae bacterium]|nr:hypothetical protein [Microscillaceae bacterium]
MQNLINQFLEQILGSSQIAKATITETENGLYDIEYHTNWADDAEYAIFQFVAQAEITSKVHSLTITSDDEGINGTQYWDLSYLLQNNTLFPFLSKFILPLNTQNPTNHNRIIVTYEDSYEENGALGKLLDACPALEVLHTPSAPNASFFERTTHSLKNLTIQTGFEGQHFITNLAQSTCFQSLQKLDFTEYAETYMDDFLEKCLSFEEYKHLLLSSNLPNLKNITLRKTQLNEQEKAMLKEIAQEKDIHLLLID